MLKIQSTFERIEKARDYAAQRLGSNTREFNDRAINIGTGEYEKTSVGFLVGTTKVIGTGLLYY